VVVRHDIGLLPIAFFSVMVAFVLTAGIFLPLADEVALKLHQMTSVEAGR
jgi:hypothetical protein